MSSALTYDVTIGSALSSSVDNTFRALKQKTQTLSKSLGKLKIGTKLTDSIDNNFKSLEKKKDFLTGFMNTVPVGEGLAKSIDTVFNNAHEKAVGVSSFIKGVGSDLSQIKSVFKRDKKDDNPSPDNEPENPAEKSKKLVTDFKSVMGEFQTTLAFETPEHFKEIGNDLIALSSRMPRTAKGMGKMIKVAGGVNEAKKRFDALKGSVSSLGTKYGLTGDMAKSAMLDMFPSLGPLGEKMGSLLQPLQGAWGQAKEMAGAASESWKSASEGYSHLRKNITRANLALIKNKAATGAAIVKNRAAAASTWLLGAAQRATALASRAWASVQWALNAAMMANPIGVIVAGALALGAVAFAVYKNWTPILGFFKGLWGSMGKKINSTITGIKKMANTIRLIITGAMPLSAVASKIYKHLKPIHVFFKRLWGTVGKMINGIKAAIDKVPFLGKFFSSGKKVIAGSAFEETSSNVIKLSERQNTAQKTSKKRALPRSQQNSRKKTAKNTGSGNSTQPVTVSFGDIHITATDGKIDADSLKMQIEEAIHEITWRTNERSFSDVA